MISISKNVYIDKFDDIVNKYNNTYHSTNKTKPVHINPSIYIYIYVFDKQLMRKILNLKLVIILE